MTETKAKNNRSSIPRAVALQYADIDELPSVTASGLGEAARQIVALAQEHHIPVAENGALVETLSRAAPGQAVNSEAFYLVAELIAFLYHVDEQWRRDHSFLDPILAHR